MTARTRALYVILLALSLALVIVILFGYSARAEITSCRDDPGRQGRWIYRIIDGHRCYFEANGLRRGREKPRQELAWPNYAAPQPSEFEQRWHGRGHPEGWDHQE